MVCRTSEASIAPTQDPRLPIPGTMLVRRYRGKDIDVCGGAATGEGGDRIVCDDPHNVQEAESDAVRKATLDWFDVVMSTRVNDPKTAAKVVVMQRCHQQDLSGHLIEQGSWEHLRLPAEEEGSQCPVADNPLGPGHPRGTLQCGASLAEGGGFEI